MDGKVDNLAVISGIVMVALGVVLLVISVFVPFLVFYALIVLVLGVVILLTLREQEKIEPIKTKEIKTKRGKK